MVIIQLSDVHFSKNTTPTLGFQTFAERLNDTLVNHIEKGDQINIVICGDIVFKADTDGYKLAIRFFNFLSKYLDYTISYYACPGNHDIIGVGNDFQLFNAFVWQLTKTSDISFCTNRTSVSVNYKNKYHIILANSSYHKDHKYGLVNINDIRQELKKYSHLCKIIVLHHHLIPVHKNDISTIRNSYELLVTAASQRVIAIIHGHRHTSHCMSICKNNIPIIGVGSPFFLDSPNINNQVNILKFSSDGLNTAISLKYFADHEENGKVGCFIENPIRFS